MITKINQTIKAQLKRIMSIWLTSNLAANAFVGSDYWMNRYSPIRKQLLAATVYVAIKDEQIIGGAAILDDQLIGPFVDQNFRQQDIATQLLNQCKAEVAQISTSVYLNNPTAIMFYEQNDFVIKGQFIEEATNEVRYQMKWHKD